MKTIILTAALVTSMLANAISVQAAPRTDRLDGYKFFEDIANRTGG